MARGLTLTLLLLLIALSVIIIPAPMVASESPHITCDGENTNVDINQSVKYFNSNSEAVPLVIASVASSNKTELRITNTTGTATSNYTVQMDQSLNVTDVYLNSTTDPDLVVTTSRSVACSIYTAEKPVERAQRAYNNDNITTEASGLMNKAKLGAVDIAADITGLF